MISQDEYQVRRVHLANQLKANSVVVLSSAPSLIRNQDCYYQFRQNSDFFYLSGFDEPEAKLVIAKESDRVAYYLFCRPSCYQEELWEGMRAGLDGAKATYLADEAFDIATFDEVILQYLAKAQTVYYNIGKDADVDSKISSWFSALSKRTREGLSPPQQIEDLSLLVSEMRLIKSDSEANVMRQAAEISARAHVRAMKQAKQSRNECELAAELVHEFMKNGCSYWAYDSIVASGKNACILHYTDNNQAIKTDDLILIDAGCELYNYAADITRTFPASGQFTQEQEAIYRLVLKAQLAGIEVIKPGVLWTEVQKVIVEIITEGLVSLGLLKGDVDKLIEDGAYAKFYMHRSGHWLGIDVHDVGSYKKDGQWRPFEKGMVLTVEPGIYIADVHKDVDAKWHHIGVRIEDDILVTDNGYEVLTKDVPKSVEEVCALVNHEG